MPAKTNETSRVFEARFRDPGVQSDAGNCVRNWLQRAGAVQVDKTGTICIHPAPLLRCFKLLSARGRAGPGNLVTPRAAKKLLKAYPQPLAQLLRATRFGGSKETAKQLEGRSRGGRARLKQTNPVYYSGRAKHKACGKWVNIKEAAKMSDKPGVSMRCRHCQETAYFNIERCKLKVVKGKVVRSVSLSGQKGSKSNLHQQPQQLPPGAAAETGLQAGGGSSGGGSVSSGNTSFGGVVLDAKGQPLSPSSPLSEWRG
ncbi:hypothetical protein HXX76_008154 [Chlamydomonas incerta]|uniref:Uncharacterized protein n=1 Tax=Chlamydomonas incerta TaxID=51695 RepID=A0A835W2P1_CHLIN|nr:hypothetical protein HXX76_008154 [Chlamydomonas incerta]|eukprot:KAG2433796.1 hypothetical protein HXX76_008154 [Chlamydomonas incerta]